MNIDTLRIILGDQLSLTMSSLDDLNKANDIILMCEVDEETQYVKHHKKKIAFLFSAMRHFELVLQAQGIRTRYIKLDDPDNSGSFAGEIAKAVQLFHPRKVVVTHPGEYRVLALFHTLAKKFSISLEIREDKRFLVSHHQFAQWAKGRDYFRLEHFYRKVRAEYDILMENNQPIGGQWNFDESNRLSPSTNLKPPSPFRAPIDEVTQQVVELVQKRFADHFGDLEPFYFAVTRVDALAALHHFIHYSLAHFGSYQDAMIENEPWMFHSHLSFYLNCGLLEPLECVRAAENAYKNNLAPLNSVEGFIRQIIGWREFVRGIYWLKMPQYSNENFLNAKRKLPQFFWNMQTSLNCLKQCLTETKKNAYAHHIQRLMVIGNFAILTGLNPMAVSEWYLLVYADAYEWVELPNVYGMILFADGGVLASKPYIASANYINKMSNYCHNCQYNVNEKNGESACPFNYLYWNFIDTHRDKFAKNPRMGMVYKTYDKMTPSKKLAIQTDSEKFFADHLL
ncbi:MAG: cryptochrome/photolyase family protein [Legionellales bacterium]|nr:cryptochrome/photolyase family protein [Legionellales bacterium]